MINIIQLILMMCMLSVLNSSAQKTNDTSLNNDLIISVETGESVWINDSTLFEAPNKKSKSASKYLTARISASQRLTYEFVHHKSNYYTNHERATIMMSLDESGKIAGCEILRAPFSRSVLDAYIEYFRSKFYYTPAKINGKPVKAIGIMVFEMGPQEDWRAGGPIDTFSKKISTCWSPIIE